MSVAAMLLLALAANGAELPRVSIISRGPAAPGEVILIAVTGQSKKILPKGSYGGQPLSFFRAATGAYAALIGFDLDTATGSAKLDLELHGDTPYFWSTEIIVDTKTFPSQQLKVAEQFVNPPKVEEDRAEEESRRLRRLFDEETKTPLFSGRFKSPIPGARSARFGERRFFNGVPKNPHSGADLRAGKGEPIKAPSAGRVVLTDDLFYSGKTVVLDHGLGLYTSYSHLSKIEVTLGQHVVAGKTIGRVGNTGRVTGPHLHWGVKLRGARIDPFALTFLPLDKYRP